MKGHAARHPDDVAGMVLLDTMPEDYRDEGDARAPMTVRLDPRTRPVPATC